MEDYSNNRRGRHHFNRHNKSKPPHAAKRISWAQSLRNEDIFALISYELRMAHFHSDACEILSELVHEIKYRLVEYDKRDEQSDSPVEFASDASFREATTEDIEIVLQAQLLKARASEPQSVCIKLMPELTVEIANRLRVYEEAYGEIPQKDSDK